MNIRLLAVLLRALLDLCRRCARLSLHWLLRIFSGISPRRRVVRSAAGDDKMDKDMEGPFSPSSYTDDRGEVQCSTIERPVLACSSTPRKPPPTRSYTRHTSIESYQMGPTCTTPTSTLRDSPPSTSPTSYTIQEQPNLERGLSSTSESVTAEPAGFVLPPRKPFRSYLPSMTSRYDRNIIIPNDIGPWLFKPLETITIYSELDVPSWKHYVQPEGQLYFRNDSRKFQYLTEENLSNHSLLAEAELLVSTFERRTEEIKGLPRHVEVVFEMREKYWRYYMVDLDHRCLFWIDDCIIDDMVLPGNFGVEHREHFRYMFEFEYWQHIDYFPTHRPLQEGLLDELQGILLQQHIDVVTSLTSTSAFDGDELKSLIGSIKKLQALKSSDNARPYVVQSSARMMAVVANERFFNFFGFHGARLSPQQSVRGATHEKNRSPLIRLLSPILFYAPEVHLVALENVWVDNVIKARLWKSFQSKIERDWEGFILYATVLVNANVAFLAIPSVISDDLAPEGLSVSPAAAVSQISVIASLGSIIIGLLLVRQMRIGAKDSCEDYLAFLESRSHPQLGLETLAILYSLPYALLIWGMATFLTAVAIICFHDIGGDGTYPKRIVYGVVWLFIVMFILWTIRTGWEKNRRHGPQCPSDYPAEEVDSSPSGSDPGSCNPGASTQSDISDSRSMRSVRSHRSRLTVSSTRASSIGYSLRSSIRKVAGRRSARPSTWSWSFPWISYKNWGVGSGNSASHRGSSSA